MDTRIKIPKVSVVMPVYNGERFLKQAIDSVLAQTFTDFELLIINDGSTDTSTEILKAYSDSRIKIITNEINRGLIQSLNDGIKASIGEYIARMDADDVCVPERFAKQVAFLDANQTVSMVATHVVFIDENNLEAGHWREDMVTCTVEEIKAMLPKENCIAHPTIMIRRDILQSKGYNKLFKNSEDWGLWLTLLSEGKVIAKLDEVLLKYRIHASGTTVKANAAGPLRNIIRYQRKYIGYKLTTFKFRGTDYNVLRSYVQRSIKFYFPFIYALAGKIYSTNIIKFIRQYRSVKQYFRNNSDKVTNIFFFPFYIVGGAEFVHASILEAVADKKPVAFITSKSGNTGMLAEYQKSAEVIDIYYLLVWPFTKKWLTNKIKMVCAQSNKLKLFSSNSKYYYELLSSLPANINATDLIHAFVHDYEQGAESWSLPVADKLAHRVVITRKTANDLKQLYKRNNVPDSFNNRVICIPNFVEMKGNPKKRDNKKLKVIYVGRGTSEKRIELISAAAEILSEKHPEIEFHFVGNVKNAIPVRDLKHCILHGEISDKNILGELYNEAHILVITSSREGFPISIMEAMMSGVVPVTTNVGGISEHVVNNGNGMLINATAKEEITGKLVEIIEELYNDRNKLNTLALNAYNYAVKHFNKENFVESYRNILTD